MNTRFKWLVALAASAFLVGCERPPIEVDQDGFRGTAMGDVINPRTEAELEAANQVPDPQPAAVAAGPLAGDIYQNVQVLGDLHVPQFTRLMQALTEWVAPEEGCTYCHVGENFAAEDIYTKHVSRRMLQMTAAINKNWTDHVADTGVTCYTCHRGNNIPEYVWATNAMAGEEPRMLGYRDGQNMPAETVAWASLPADPFTPYLVGEGNEIRVTGPEALPSGHETGLRPSEHSFALMMHMSDSLGVNCTYCHNTRNFAGWEGSPPQRVTAWHGIRMVRETNNDYVVPLTDRVPDKRKGPLGDILKTNCTTCHQGLNKPLYGVSMLEDYPELNAVDLQ